MIITIIACKTWDRSEAGEVIYHGADGEKAQAIGLEAFKKGYVRVGKTINPPLIPLHPPAVMAEAKPAAPAKAAENPEEVADQSQTKPKSKK